jgi:hypothetical protein
MSSPSPSFVENYGRNWFYMELRSLRPVGIVAEEGAAGTVAVAGTVADEDRGEK